MGFGGVAKAFCLPCAILSRGIGILVVWIAAEYLYSKFSAVGLVEVKETAQLQGQGLTGLLVLLFGLTFVVPPMTRSALKRRSTPFLRALQSIVLISGLVFVYHLAMELPSTNVYLEAMLPYRPVLGALGALFAICYVLPGTYPVSLFLEARDARKPKT
ncbi:hypothetical protein KHP62_07885 [Rhodobacteraceae bacterium NNCM2]|nr:hypothetical protein [Coraliihabitans acroporae]